METTFANKVCPRCNQDYEGFGGLSRLDNKTQICSECEVDESLEDFFHEVTPMTLWPIKKPWSNNDVGRGNP